MSTIPRTPRGAALFIHGAGGGGWEWNRWRYAFDAAGWRTHAPDLVPAPGGLARTTLDDYIAAVRAQAAALARPVLVGASLGGLIAAAIARDVEAAALVLVNPVPPAGLDGPLETRDIVPWGRARSLAGTARAMPDADDASRLYAFRRWRDESGAVLRAARAGVTVAPPSCPLLVVASGCDDDVPAAASRALAQAWQGELLELPDASHTGPLLGRSANAVAAHTLNWLAKCTLQSVTSANRT